MIESDSLFDAAERTVDLRDLGEIVTTYCNDDRGVLVFERGRVHVTPGAWFALSRTLSRRNTA